MDKTASALQGVQIKESKFQELIHRIQEWALLQGIAFKYCILLLSIKCIDDHQVGILTPLIKAVDT